MFEITPLQKLTWGKAFEGEELDSSQSQRLADALRDTLARALKAEMEIHIEFQACTEDEHLATQSWTDTDWQAEAERELKGG